MSESEYQDETCEGCFRWSAHEGCTAERNNPGDIQPRDPCELFAPSLRCRDTKARERVAVALERIAFHFCLAAEVRIGLARADISEEE